MVIHIITLYSTQLDHHRIISKLHTVYLSMVLVKTVCSALQLHAQTNCDWIYDNRLYWHKKWIPICYWLLNLHPCTKLAIDGQVCFHWRLITNPVKPPWWTTGSVGLVNGTNKDVTGAKLLPTTVSTCAVEWVTYWRHSTASICVLMESLTRLRLPTHPPPPPTPYNVPFVI